MSAVSCLYGGGNEATARACRHRRWSESAGSAQAFEERERLSPHLASSGKRRVVDRNSYGRRETSKMVNNIAFVFRIQNSGEVKELKALATLKFSGGLVEPFLK
jgi:hypothetical protein